jgi:hypothetical protein
VAQRIVPRWRAVLLVLAAIVVGPWLLFVIVANVLLASGGVEAIATRATPYTSVSLEHGRAWTLWPTRVHVRDARLRIDSFAYELDLQVPEAVVEMHLLDLFDRRVHFERIVANDVRGAYRSKLDPDEIDDPIVRAYPRLDGTPPEVQPDTPIRRKPRDRAWGVDLDAIEAYFESLWVDEFLTEPCGRVRGAMHWTAGYELEVPRVELELESAALWIAEHEVMREMWGSGQLELTAFPTWETPPTEVPRHLYFSMRLEAAMRDPAAAELYLPRIAGMIGRGAGRVEADVSARAGELLPGSRMHYRSDGVDFGSRALWVRSAADVTLSITERGQPHADIVLRGARLVAGERVFGRADETIASFTAQRADMMRPWKLASAHAKTDALRVDDLRPLSDLDDSERWWFTGGRASVRVDAQIGKDGMLKARFGVDGRGVGIATATAKLSANVSTRGVLEASRREGLVVQDVRGALEDVSLRTPKGSSKGSWLRIEKAELRAMGRRMALELRAEVEDARPALIHLTDLDPLVKAVPELSQLERVKLRARVRTWPGQIEVEIVEAEQLMLESEGLWRKRGRDWRAAFVFRGLAHTGYEAEPGRKHVAPLEGESWLRERKAWVRDAGKQKKVN